MDQVHPIIQWLMYLGLLEVAASAVLVAGGSIISFLLGRYMRRRNRLDNG
jgi:hypothetical protein